MDTRERFCEKFNRKFDPEAPVAPDEKPNYYGHNINIWAASEFIASELLTEDVVAAFAEKHLRPKIEWNKTSDGGVYTMLLEVEMEESHPLFTKHLHQNARIGRDRLFEIRKKRGRDNRMYNCNCKPAEDSIMESGLKQGMDEREILRGEVLNYLDTMIQRTAAKGYEDVLFVDEILRRIGNDEDAERFARIMERRVGFGTNMLNLDRYTARTIDERFYQTSIYNAELRAELIETYRRYKDASGEETP